MNTAQITGLMAQRKLHWQLVIKITVGILVCLAAGYLTLSAYAGHNLSTPHRNFDPKEAAVFAASPEEVKIPATDGLEISGWFIPSIATDKVLILVHGRNSSRSHEFGGKFPEFAEAMHRRGFSVLMIDLRGNGRECCCSLYIWLNRTTRRYRCP